VFFLFGKGSLSVARTGFGSGKTKTLLEKDKSRAIDKIGFVPARRITGLNDAHDRWNPNNPGRFTNPGPSTSPDASDPASWSITRKNFSHS
jgi:hypothetical protein